jgi:chromate transporter
MIEPRTTWGLLRYFLYLGSLGFGGPVALIGYMQRDLVEMRAWFTKEEYLKGLALSQLAPGPLAAQLAICLGYSTVGSGERRSSAWPSSCRPS